MSSEGKDSGSIPDGASIPKGKLFIGWWEKVEGSWCWMEKELDVPAGATAKGAGATVKGVVLFMKGECHDT